MTSDLTDGATPGPTPDSSPDPTDQSKEGRVCITLRYFAVLREQRGVETEQRQVPAGMTVSALYHEIFPPGPDGTLPVLYAVDQCYVGADEKLLSDVELAFIPPLGGG